MRATEDEVSVASSVLSDSECERILGRGFCKNRKKANEPASEASVYFSFERLDSGGSKQAGGDAMSDAIKGAVKTEQTLNLVDYTKSERGPPGSHKSTHLAEGADAPDKPGHSSAETQTVAVQTSDRNLSSEEECRCERCTCGCEDESCESESESEPPPPPPPRRCNCCACRKRAAEACTLNQCADPCSDNSDDDYSSDFLSLPYQNNDEYLQLLCELERKLIARNRERVRKRRLEFEKRSREGQPQQQCCAAAPPPQPEAGSYFCRKFPRRTREKRCRCCSHKRPANADPNEHRWQKCNFIDSFTRKLDLTNCSQIERSLNKSHWQLDPKSGEWIKVSSYEEKKFASPNGGAGECRQPIVKECPCCRKKRLYH